MKRIFRVLAAAGVIATSACAHKADPYVSTYRGAVIVKGVTTEAHKEAWSDPLRETAAACDEKLSGDDVPDEEQYEDLQACLGPYNAENNDKVVKSLAAYKAAATALTAALIAAEGNPEGVDQDALNEALRDTLAAARELIALFPESQAWVDRLELLTKGLVK